MVTIAVTEALRVSSEFANRLDDLVAHPRGFPIKDDGDWMLASQWAINASLHNSLLTLFRDNFPAGAFSLLRPICETLVRTHLIAMGDAQIIDQMRKDKFRTKFFKDPEKVDNHFQLGGTFKSLYDQITNFMHSAVHMGMQQMKRQFKGNDLEPNYPEHEIIALVNMSTFAKGLVTARLVERFQTHDELQVVLALLREFKLQRREAPTLWVQQRGKCVVSVS
jgi:hypothetical protein